MSHANTLPVIVLVTGGRDYPDWGSLYQALDHVHRLRGIAAIYEGGASGADAGARQWAMDNGVPLHTYQAEWGKYGKSAGPIRNHTMLQALLLQTYPKMVMAFPGGSGTAGMVELTNAAIAMGHQVYLCDLREHLGGVDGGGAGKAKAHGGVGEQTRPSADRQPGKQRTH